jgi:flagellar FliL protein
MPKKVVIIGAAALVLAAGGAVPVMLHRSPSKAAVTVKPKLETKPMELDEFLVNLSDTGDPHYLKCTIVLEMAKSSKPSKGGESKDDPDTARIRDTIISTLGKRHFNELLAPQGKDQLKASIVHDVNKALGEDRVTEVYFTAFAMQ